MSQEELERLAWERIDGTITDEDRARLDQAMAVDPEMRRRFDELCRLSDELALAEEVEPPPELRSRIDRAVVAASPGWRRRAAGRGMPLRPLLYAAAGLVLGVVVGRLLIPATPIDGPRATGAMVPRAERPTDALLIELGGGTGTVAVWGAGPSWIVETALHRHADVELVLDAGDGRIEVRSSSSQGSVATEAIEDDERLVVISEGVGRTVTSFELGGPDPKLQLVVRSRGQLLAQRTLHRPVPE